MNKLKLGYGISLPIEYDNEIPEYSVENINLIKDFSKQFKCVQLMFSKSKLSVDELKSIKLLLKDYKYIYVHSSYQINMGSDLLPSKTDLYNNSIELAIIESDYAKKIGAKGIVIHMGKNVKKKYESAHVYNNMVKFVIELFKKMKEKKNQMQILFETSAGQGGEMCWELDEFVKFITCFSKLPFYSQIGVCLDTCHIFQAGYDFNKIKQIELVHKIFEPIKNKIKLIHLNDSFHDVGEHIDRHEQIGKGKIQIDKLIKFIYPYKSIPMILETTGPYIDQISYLTNTK